MLNNTWEKSKAYIMNNMRYKEKKQDTMAFLVGTL
jgi:hypothetical protein